MRRLITLADSARAAGDVELSTQLLVGAARRVWWGDPGAEVRHEIVLAAQRIGLTNTDPRWLVILAVSEPIERGAFVVSQLATWRPDADGHPDVAGVLGLAAFCAGDFSRAIGFLSSPAEALRSQGRLSLLAQSLALRAWSAIYLGSFDVARSADEAMRLADETRQPVWGATARIAIAMLHGIRGDEGPAAELLLEAELVASRGERPMSALLAGIQLARAVTELGAGHYDAAYDHLRRIFDPSDPSFHHVQRLWAVTYLAEAALHTGRRSEVLDLFAGLEAAAGPEPSPAVAVAFDYARAVLADDATAEQLFRNALAGPGGQRPWHRARAELAYGVWLRRHRRAVDARLPLRSARDTLDALGATAWARQADQELRAAGERRRPHQVDVSDILSPQEEQIALLAAAGLSNREISQRLFLSHRTVGSHLYRIFPKLGITSRAQLGEALTASTSATTSRAGLPDAVI